MVLKFTVGQLRKVVEFKKNNAAASGAGWNDSYSTLLTTRGFIRKLSGSRDLSSGEILNENAFELFVRFQQTIENNLKADLKIVIDGKTFAPRTWEKIGEKRFYHRFIITEVGRN